MKRTILMMAALTVVGAPLAAQQPAGRTDRIGHIVAVVGDSAILNFDIQEGVLAREAVLRRDIPDSGPEYDAIAAEVLEQRIAELLLVQAAQRDTTIKVLDDQVNRLVEEKIQTDLRQLGGQAGLDRVLAETGLTMAAYRERLAVQYRKQSLIDQYRGKLMRARKPPPVREEELRTIYNENQGQFGQRPATVTFQQIMVNTEPSAAALARARQLADSIFQAITRGADFETLAKQHGMDATRERGGDLGWFRRNDMVREFANVAFSLRPGAVSAPVRTQFGFHIIKVERARGAEVQARHILIRPEITDADALAARARADTVADRLRAGADAQELWRRYGDQDEALRQGPVETGPVEAGYGIDLSTAAEGTVFGPIPIGQEEVASQFVVVKLLNRESERPWSLDDVALRDRLRQDLQMQKLMEEIVAELRRSTYVEIRDR